MGIGNIKIWNEAKHPLLFLFFDLNLRHFDLAEFDLHFRDGCGYTQHDWRDNVSLVRAQDS